MALTGFFFLLGFVVIVVVVGRATSEEGMRFECLMPSQCGQGECCTIGRQRFSMPSCQKYGGEGSVCIRDNRPQNLSLSYPNGQTIDMIDAYSLFCPCDQEQNLICERGKCVSQSNSVSE